MTIARSGRPGVARGKASNAGPNVKETTCPCGKSVLSVTVAGDRVIINPDADAGGDITAMSYGGRTVYTTANTDGFNGPQLRYRTHRCRVTESTRTRLELRKRLDQLDTIGPCRRCYTPNSARPYGPNPKLFCDTCEIEHAARN